MLCDSRLGCPENAKSLKSQAPQGFSGCLDIDNDEMNKKKFLSASLWVTQALRSFIYFCMKRPIMKKMFWHKNGTSKPQNGLIFSIYHDIEPIFEKNLVGNSTTRGQGFPEA